MKVWKAQKEETQVNSWHVTPAKNAAIMSWVIKCSPRHYEWWDALKLTGYYLPVIRFCHGLNYFKEAYLGNHAICCSVCAVCVRLPPLSWCPSTLLSLAVFSQLFILRMNIRWRQKAGVYVESGGAASIARLARSSHAPYSTPAKRKTGERGLLLYAMTPTISL